MASKALSVREHNRTLLQTLEVGDMIEFPRGAYSHWALYIGNEEVIHLAGDENDGINGQFDSTHLLTICGQSFRKALVKVDSFWDVVADSFAKKNNQKDTKYTPLPRGQIMENALSRLGSIGYNVMFDNCEHFTAWCRYGVKKSDQVDNFLTAFALGTAAIATGGLLYGLSRSSKTKEEKEEEKL